LSTTTRRDEGGGGSAKAEDTEADTYNEMERAKKKRKVTRELHEYIGVPSDGERKYRGWSDEGMAAFAGWMRDIQKDGAENKYTAWEAAYHIIMEKLGNGKKKDKETVQQKKYKPNMRVVWEGCNVA
jgi:hypothetical protein